MYNLPNIYQPSYLLVYLPITTYLPTHPPTYLLIIIYLFTYLHTHLYIGLPTDPPTHLLIIIYILIYLPTHLPPYLLVYLPIHPPISYNVPLSKIMSVETKLPYNQSSKTTQVQLCCNYILESANSYATTLYKYSDLTNKFSALKNKVVVWQLHHSSKCVSNTIICMHRIYTYSQLHLTF